MAFAVSLVTVALLAPSVQAADQPSRVVIIVLDQARPDTITRYGMTNVQELQRKGTSFPNALVGHMAAETVISHNVLTSGLFPKHMGWTNEVYRDSNNALAAAPDFPTGGAPGEYYVTSSMSCAQFARLIDVGGYKKLQDYLDSRFGQDSSFASIAQKRTSACTGGHTSSGAGDGSATDPEDIIFQIRDLNVSAACGSGWRRPEYIGQPRAYFGFTNDCTDRWWTFQGTGAYDTGSISPANIYPLDGNRFVPGFDTAHLGGDNGPPMQPSATSKRAGLARHDGEPRRHRQDGSHVGPRGPGAVRGPPGAPGTAAEKEMRHMPFVAKNADVQVGRIVDALEAKGLLDDTLIVITADHAAQTGRPFHGLLAPAVTNPQCSDPPRTPRRRRPRPGSGPIATGTAGRTPTRGTRTRAPRSRASSPRLVGTRTGTSPSPTRTATSRHGSKDTSLAKKREAAEAVLDMAGVIASYHTNTAQNDYRLYGTNPMSGRERSWFVRHGEELVDTMAAPNGPDVVGLVATDVTYGVIGDHGGHNKLIQNIPMVFYGPGVGSKDSNRELRHVDVLPTILETMGIDYDEDAFDGEAVKLSKPKD